MVELQVSHDNHGYGVVDGEAPGTLYYSVKILILLIVQLLVVIWLEQILTMQ